MDIDVLIPKRPAMPIVSREIFNSTRFAVTLTKAGLIVQNHRTGKGVCIPPSHKQYADWVDAFDTALDADESYALCRALT